MKPIEIYVRIIGYLVLAILVIWAEISESKERKKRDEILTKIRG